MASWLGLYIQMAEFLDFLFLLFAFSLLFHNSLMILLFLQIIKIRMRSDWISPISVVERCSTASYPESRCPKFDPGSFCFMSWCLIFFVLLAPYVCFHISN